MLLEVSDFVAVGLQCSLRLLDPLIALCFQQSSLFSYFSDLRFSLLESNARALSCCVVVLIRLTRGGCIAVVETAFGKQPLIFSNKGCKVVQASRMQRALKNASSLAAKKQAWVSPECFLDD
jgi:hypothetical protein